MTLDDGRTVTADRQYLIRSIRDPGAQVVAGFGGHMPTIELTDAELEALLAYIEGLA